MIIKLHDKSGNPIGTADLPAERIGEAGVINWIDGYFTFWNFNEGVINFIEVRPLLLDDEEVTKLEVTK